MAVITSDMVKDLRQRSGAGIMECKEALGETGGDMEAALDFLRKKGAAKAAKKADRSAKEGAVSGVVSGKTATLVELKCETDFVGRNDLFQKLAKDIASHVSASPFVEGEEAFFAQPFQGDKSKTIKDLLASKIHELGENIVAGRRVRYDLSGPGGFGLYIHGAGNIGSLVELGAASDAVASSEKFQQVARDLAMHVAAANPLALSSEGIPADILARERAIFEDQTRQSGKPENLIPKIVEGRIKKFYSESCLNEQAFIKDPDKSVGVLLKETSKELGGELTIRRFVRLQLGE
ncbi:MAG: elongation factor Ts [Nitrospinae bacterium]|nr:elongation factor Ts [Nitrospinota bacterium]